MSIMNVEFTLVEVSLMKHSLGVHRHDRNGGFCPREFYRNYFNCGSENHADYKTLASLSSRGLMIRNDCKEIGIGFSVTNNGIDLVREIVGSLLKCECGVEIIPVSNCSECEDVTS